MALQLQFTFTPSRCSLTKLYTPGVRAATKFAAATTTVGNRSTVEYRKKAQ